MEPEIELVVDAGANVGESPVWSAADSAVYWIDIKAPALYRTEHPGGATRCWALPWDIGGFALLSKGGERPDRAVVALRLGLFLFDFASGRLEALADAPFDPRTHRFNESGCDSSGRLWVGTMFEPPAGLEAEPVPGPLFSFAPGEGLRRHDAKAMTANGFAWGRDGRTFYMACSKAGRIDAYAFDAEHGRFGSSRRFADIDPAIGVPDGAAMDEEGFYWCAVHGGGRLLRFAPDGRLDREVMLPVDNPTKPAFAGPDLDMIYVTSAAHGRQGGRSHEGGLFRFRPGVRGQPLPMFKP